MMIFYGVAALLLPARKTKKINSIEFKENSENLIERMDQSVYTDFFKMKESGTSESIALWDKKYQKALLLF